MIALAIDNTDNGDDDDKYYDDGCNEDGEYKATKQVELNE